MFFYAATEFYASAWKSLQHRFLNIDAPIVLAIYITFGRSMYEIISGMGAGYLDSMSGIVFFMLLGSFVPTGYVPSAIRARSASAIAPYLVVAMR